MISISDSILTWQAVAFAAAVRLTAWNLTWRTSSAKNNTMKNQMESIPEHTRTTCHDLNRSMNDLSFAVSICDFPILCPLLWGGTADCRHAQLLCGNGWCRGPGVVGWEHLRNSLGWCLKFAIYVQTYIIIYIYIYIYIHLWQVISNDSCILLSLLILLLGGLIIYFCIFFFCGRFWIIWGFLVLCFPVSHFFCFSASLLTLLLCLLFFSCFSAFLLFAFPAFPASLLFLLLCFSAFVLLCLSTSTILHFRFFSHVFLLLYFLLLCFFASCLYCLFVFHFLLLYSVLFVS